MMKIEPTVGCLLLCAALCPVVSGCNDPPPTCADLSARLDRIEMNLERRCAGDIYCTVTHIWPDRAVATSATIDEAVVQRTALAYETKCGELPRDDRNYETYCDPVGGFDSEGREITECVLYPLGDEEVGEDNADDE